jgi:hypothetical protein
MSHMRRALIVLSAWTAVAILFAIQARFQGETPRPWSWIAAWQLAGWWSWAAFTPLVGAAAVRGTVQLRQPRAGVRDAHAAVALGVLRHAASVVARFELTNAPPPGGRGAVATVEIPYNDDAHDHR